MTSSERYLAAKSEIARRRELATAVAGGEWRLRPTEVPGLANIEISDAMWPTAWTEHAAFIAANDPQHVLRVLDAASGVLDRHDSRPWTGFCYGCARRYPCPDAAAILDLFAPEPAVSGLSGQAEQ